ncbi:MAG: ACT domain-containing protein [Candidatus Diapherotrites archaeon]|uniref:ACT domain-containing protein n=1 Tax=Candidatus Iainarchaeum sp. TaxID=3101447 RepID=A0A8T3YLE6_9ARCH|nr:ACT domain-containing protein [Candidatus Diapherotrites archaeon]
MGRNGDNGHSLSEAVRHEIDTMPHVKSALSDGIVNYSALARSMLQPLGEKLGKSPNEESVIVAIKRYADELEKQEHPNFASLFSEAEITLQDNMAYAHFKKRPHVVEKVEKLFGHGDWRLGEMRVLLQGADQVMVIMKDNRLHDLVEELSDDVVHSFRNSAMLTFRMPLQSFSTYGVLAEITSHLAKKGISIELLSSPPDIHFIVDETNAERAYNVLKHLINESKKTVEENSTK